MKFKKYYQAESYLQSTSHGPLRVSEEYEPIFESTAATPDLALLERLILEQQAILYTIGMMSSTLLDIKRELEDLKERLLNIRSEQIMVVREVPFDEAKRMIEEYIADKEGEVVTPLEIADALKLPYEDVYEIFWELVKEGKLEILDEGEEE